jgi:hypothetical protein
MHLGCIEPALLVRWFGGTEVTAETGARRIDDRQEHVIVNMLPGVFLAENELLLTPLTFNT